MGVCGSDSCRGAGGKGNGLEVACLEIRGFSSLPLSFNWVRWESLSDVLWRRDSR